MQFREINFGPYGTLNVLDAVGRIDLRTKGGQKVEVKRYTPGGFTIYIGGVRMHENLDNLQASYALNSAQVGSEV